MTGETSKKTLLFRILSPDAGIEPISCEAVTLTVADGKNGNECGLYCIHPGHANAVLLLDRGEVSAGTKAGVVFKARTAEGLARIETGSVTVTVSEFSVIS